MAARQRQDTAACHALQLRKYDCAIASVQATLCYLVSFHADHRIVEYIA